ncbi:MAG: alkaline phosphatase family protein [Gammaproteobacteria bacterium]|nr:alkaline phosphatase family protein [Gammaproteobacteria bacterium]
MQEYQRVIIAMIDGLGSDYLEASDMPRLKAMAGAGLSTSVQAVMPTVTNANNASICCGAWPDEHGITGNSYYDETQDKPEYMESGSSILVPTMIERAASHGVKAALLTSKKKTINLLGAGCEIALAAEAPPQEYIDRFGPAPDIYSREINYWLWEVAIDLLENRPDIGFLYVHTTDYPMHMWPPEALESRQHQAELDRLLGRAVDAAPDAAMLLTADHGMNFKRRCWDLARACRLRQQPLRFALSAERDRYIKHHRTFGGTAWIWLHDPADAPSVSRLLLDLEGIEAVLTRDEAAARFRLLPERIGDLVVLGDQHTVFGELDGVEMEVLPAHYRTHGSIHELDVPLVVHNFQGELPEVEAFKANLDLTRLLLGPLWPVAGAAADRMSVG